MNKEAKAKWSRCKELIRKQLRNDSEFATWFQPTEAHSLRGNHLTLLLPSAFYQELYETKYSDLMVAALKEVLGSFRLSYIYQVVKDVKGGTVKLPSETNVAAKAAAVAPPAQKTNPANALKRRAQEPEKTEDKTPDYLPQLNSALSFENYCVSPCNKLPWTIAESIARQPFNSNFNPFFLYGDVGVGKTHLMQAIGLHVKKNFPDKRVVFLPMKEFQRLYQNAYIQKQIPAFLNWFSACDVLLFDDLQEIVGSEGTLNNALFPIFNHLHQHGKQLVFTCDRAPQDLEGLEDRLIDRFKWGIVEKLERPDSALRKKILTFKARKNGLELPQDVIDYIAETPLNSVREIEGIVLGIMTRAINMARDIDIELAKEVVRIAVRPGKKKAINFDMIVETVADDYRLNSDVIFTKSRVKDVAEARMLIMYIAQRQLELSSGAIGRKIGRKHSTVIHGINSVSERIKEDRDFAERVSVIEKNL